MKRTRRPFSAFDSVAMLEVWGEYLSAIGGEKGLWEPNDFDADNFSEFVDPEELKTIAKADPHSSPEEPDFLGLTFDRIAKTYGEKRQCPYCKSRLFKPQWDDREEDRNFVAFFLCRTCFWWIGYISVEIGNKDYVFAWGLSRMRRFGEQIPSDCSTELAQYVRRHPDFLHTIDPRRLEFFVADVFRANRKGGEVRHVGRTGDRGVDVVYVDEGGSDWLIQVKRRQSGRKPEPFETIQMLQGAMLGHALRKTGPHDEATDFAAVLRQRKVHGIVVSTASRFTRGAMAEAKAMLDRGLAIALIDKGLLLRMLDPVLPKEPWKVFLRQCLSALPFKNPRFKTLPTIIGAHIRTQLVDKNSAAKP